LHHSPPYHIDAAAKVVDNAYPASWRYTVISALSIELPDELADTSRAVAQRLGLTQSELVRRALVNELEKIQSDWELDAMVASFEAMKRDPSYLAEAKDLPITYRTYALTTG
jgi:predicted transcriptional regulator